MRRTTVAIFALLLVLGWCRAGAQLRTIDLTGRPEAVVTAPFSAIGQGVELRNGMFLFADSRERTVHLADVLRDSATTLGRNGAGPGEYRQPHDAISDGKGGALLLDAALARALFVSPDGRITGAEITRFDIGGSSPEGIKGVDPQGHLILMGTPATFELDSFPIERLDLATRQTLTLAWWPAPLVTVSQARKTPKGMVQDATFAHSSTWPERTAWVALPDGSVALARPTPYRIEITGPDGRRRRGPEVPYTPIKVTKAERESFRNSVGRSVADDEFPSVKPPFGGVLNAVLSSPVGEIWVGRLRAWNDSVPVYDVFDRTGTRTAQARLRPHSRVVGFGPGTIYVARQTPEDDFWHLERYRRE